MSIEQSKKNYGIELLRILSIVFVLILHILGRGCIYPYVGTEANLINHPANYYIVWYLESAAYGAVNLFAIVSGFVGLYSKFKLNRWLKLYALVFFWGMVLFLLFDKCHFIFQGFNTLLSKLIPSIKLEVEPFIPTSKNILDYIFVIGTKQYWYFNMYTILFIVMPVLNYGIQKLGKKYMALTTFALYLFTSIYKTIVDTEIFTMGGGYSAMWLIIMYMVGATAKLYYDDGFRINKLVCLFGFLLSTLFTSSFKYLFDYLAKIYPDKTVFAEKDDLLISYTGPFVIVGCIFLLFLFMQIYIKNNFARKVTSLFASATFGIYIFHVHVTIWDNLIKNRFTKLASEPTLLMLLHIFIALIAYYLFFFIFEIGRIYLFKLTRLDKLIDKIGDGIQNIVLKVFVNRKSKKELQS